MRRPFAVMIVIILAGVLLIAFETPASAVAYGCNGPDTIAETSTYAITAKTCMEKNSDTKAIRAHTKLQCWATNWDPNILIRCHRLEGRVQWYWAEGSGTPGVKSRDDVTTVDIYSPWECPASIFREQHTYRARGFDLHAVLPNLQSTRYHTHLSFPTTLTCGA
jgi:hypothetical protein